MSGWYLLLTTTRKLHSRFPRHVKDDMGQGGWGSQTAVSLGSAAGGRRASGNGGGGGVVTLPKTRQPSSQLLSELRSLPRRLASRTQNCPVLGSCAVTWSVRCRRGFPQVVKSQKRQQPVNLKTHQNNRGWLLMGKVPMWIFEMLS